MYALSPVVQLLEYAEATTRPCGTVGVRGPPLSVLFWAFAVPLGQAGGAWAAAVANGTVAAQQNGVLSAWVREALEPPGGCAVATANFVQLSPAEGGIVNGGANNQASKSFRSFLGIFYVFFALMVLAHIVLVIEILVGRGYFRGPGSGGHDDKNDPCCTSRGLLSWGYTFMGGVPPERYNHSRHWGIVSKPVSEAERHGHGHGSGSGWITAARAPRWKWTSNTPALKQFSEDAARRAASGGGGGSGGGGSDAAAALPHSQGEVGEDGSGQPLSAAASVSSPAQSPRRPTLPGEAPAYDSPGVAEWPGAAFSSSRSLGGTHHHAASSPADAPRTVPVTVLNPLALAAATERTL